LTSVSLGLGWLIFGAREFLATDVMLAGIAVIGIVGLALEKLVFERLEHYTVVRWGMLARCRARSSRSAAPRWCGTHSRAAASRRRWRRRRCSRSAARWWP